MGEEVSCPPLLLPLHSSFLLSSLEMAMAIRFSFFPFLLFRCSFLCFGIILWKGAVRYNQTCMFNGHSWRIAN